MRYSDDWMERQNKAKIRPVTGSSSARQDYLPGFSEDRMTHEKGYWIIKKPYNIRHLNAVACFSTFREATDYLKGLSEPF